MGTQNEQFNLIQGGNYANKKDDEVYETPYSDNQYETPYKNEEHEYAEYVQQKTQVRTNHFFRSRA